MNVREFRRLHAVELYEDGMRLVELAKILDVTKEP